MLLVAWQVKLEKRKPSRHIVETFNIDNNLELVPTSLVLKNLEPLAQQMDIRRYKHSDESFSPGADDDVNEDVTTEWAPPTEIVDTVVTLTTNPDGCLKRTTRRTTRTVVTTTRVRRIKNQSPLSTETIIEAPDEPHTESSSHVEQPTVYTVIGPRAESQDEQGGSCVTQAAFTFMAPTTRTEVTYEEHDSDTSRVLNALNTGCESNSSTQIKSVTDGEFSETAGVQTANEKIKKPSHLQTTVRKTVTSSAATATFVSTGMKKRTGVSANDLLVFKESSDLDMLNPMVECTEPNKTATSIIGISSGQIGEPKTNTTTTRRTTTKVMNNLAAKGLLFTRSSLENMKKPFNLWNRSDTGHANSTQLLETQPNSDVQLHIPDDTEDWALRAMKESERLFSEANFLMTKNDLPITKNDSPTNQVVVYPPAFIPTDVNRFQSRFANLPLYQGYGLIAQQLALCNRQTKLTPDDSETMTALAPLSDRMADLTGHGDSQEWRLHQKSLDPGMLPFPLGFEVNAATNALVNMLDETTERLLTEATKSIYKSLKNTSTEEQRITAALPGLLPSAEEESRTESVNQSSWKTEFPPELDTTGGEEVRESLLNRKLPTEISNETGSLSQTSAIAVGQADWNQLGRVGVPCSGAFRVAWSEMPEVVNSDALQLLTKHEIQLQEAMFEVVTSEASYYQSLQVLVKHFYNAPEFNCNSGKIETFAQTANFHTGSGSSPASVIQDLSGTVNPDSELLGNHSGNSGRRSLLKPLEKHHLFSNVLLVCLASEKFLQDLETRWTTQMPIVHEICDLVVKHAGGVTFEPYITYLRNQAYQMETLHKLCQRDSFRSALESLHANPVSGKHSISSFLALPMQRLTRLKLLVEVIRRIQDAVVHDASDAETSKRPTRIPTDRERENVQIALRELNRLLASSETEKELMDRKARLLTLSNSLEFPDNVKCLSISDKRLIKEGELREAAVNGRMSVLQKLSLRKPQSFYFILFNDLLLVTRKKKNDRYLVLDYCERAEIHAEIQRIGTITSNSTSKIPRSIDTHQGDVNSNPSTESATLASPDQRSRTRRLKTTTDFNRVSLAPLSPVRKLANSPDRKHRIRLGRSGSSVSSFQVNSSTDKSKSVLQSIQNQSIDYSRTECIHLVMNTSQNGTPMELYLLPKTSDEFSNWCKALAISPLSLLQSSLVMEDKRTTNEKTYHPDHFRL